MDSAISFYDSFLKWHGQHLRKLIWEPLQNLRSKYYKSRGQDDEATEALNDEGDNTLEIVDPTTWTDNYAGNVTDISAVMIQVQRAATGSSSTR